MAIFCVAYTTTIVREEFVEAKDFDDARAKWEKEGLDAELFFIEDEAGQQIIYD